MKVVVTGAAGHLGSRLILDLLSAGFDVRGTDFVEIHLPEAAEFVQADLRNQTSVGEALEGADLVVHCASIHPWKKYTDAEYIDTNVKGAWNLYSEASKLGISRVVLTSSISAIGYPSYPAEACPITEDCRFPINDLYGLTKNMQESIATTFAHRGEINTIALRPPPFMPRPSLETGFLLTGVFSVAEEIASAHLAAVKMMAQDVQGRSPRFEAVFVVNRLPYTREDVKSLGSDANVLPLVQKHWPDEYAWLTKKGYRGTRLAGLYDLSRAQTLLGWSPSHNFEEWYSQNALTSGGRSEIS